MLPEPGATIVRGGKRRYARFGIPGVLLCAILLYALAIAIDPWATHIGGSWTPFLYWSGSGNLVTSGGTYRLFVFFYPSPKESDFPYGRRAGNGALAGWAYVCTSRGKRQALDLRGTVPNARQNAGSNDIYLYFNETQLLNIGQIRGGFSLRGGWHGPELVMSQGEPGGRFSSGIEIEHPSVTLARGTYSDFKQMCAQAPEVP